MALLESPYFPAFLKEGFIIEIPEEHIIPFIKEGHKRVRVYARFKGEEITFHAAVRPRHGVYLMMFGKRYQKMLNIFPSDIFELKLKEDTTRYGVDMPAEFEAVLDSDPEGKIRFDSLSIGLRRSLIYHIIRYANEQTRVDKALIVIDNLKLGITDAKEIIKRQ